MVPLALSEEESPTMLPVLSCETYCAACTYLSVMPAAAKHQRLFGGTEERSHSFLTIR